MVYVSSSSRYGDGDEGFFTVYRKVFEEIDALEEASPRARQYRQSTSTRAYAHARARANTHKNIRAIMHMSAIPFRALP